MKILRDASKQSKSDTGELIQGYHQKIIKIKMSLRNKIKINRKKKKVSL